MGYLTAWKVLEQMIADLRKRGIAIPADIMNDLKSAKILINILKADPCHIETSQKVEGYLLNIESYLVSQGQKRFGANYVEEWLRRLDEASQRPHEEEVAEEEKIRFIPGLPREQKWIRVKPTAEFTLERIKALAKEANLLFNVQSDGYLLVYGEDERIKEFVKKMATKYGLKEEK
ncbi:DUF2096 family protein [Candidatus Bathyarchaeota archaeon]|nr:DUF2096 family protein [Candidatus Bathyarchaeota archaeon]